MNYLTKIIIYVILSTPCLAQIEKGSNHIGVGGIPIVDFLNGFPDNKISGKAITLNYGFLIKSNFSFGVNLYYSGVSNVYETESVDLHRESQEIKLIGLNPSLRYIFFKNEKFLINGLASFGFGNYNEKTTNLLTSELVDYGDENESVFLIMSGIGLNYFIIKNLAIELNIPYVFVNRLSTEQYVENFQTIAPTIGFQYYWRNKR